MLRQCNVLTSWNYTSFEIGWPGNSLGITIVRFPYFNSLFDPYKYTSNMEAWFYDVTAPRVLFRSSGGDAKTSGHGRRGQPCPLVLTEMALGPQDTKCATYCSRALAGCHGDKKRLADRQQL